MPAGGPVRAFEVPNRGLAMRINPIGVVGAGVIGSSLAQCVAQTGHDVILVDASEAALEKARASFLSTLRLQALFDPALANADPEQALARVTFSTDLSRLRPAPFVIENVTEEWQVKSRVFRELDTLCEDRCIFASNTSAIPIARLAGLTRRPDRVVGIHFMNPVTLKPAVELVATPQTSDETLATAKRVLDQMRKAWIPVGDSPGFVSNRVLMLTINEAIALVGEGVASARDVDRIFKSCFGHKMGPLETADLIGLDTILLSLEVLSEHLGRAKFEPCALLKRLVSDGILGRKSGRGICDHA
jgi:3-hydroxybutyryl-CoA dehydrogenase